MAESTILDGLPKSRAEAVACGSYHYFTGRPCKHGHIAKRILPGACLDCKRLADSSLRAKHLEKYREKERKNDRRRANDPILRAKRNADQRIPSRVEPKRLRRLRLLERIAGRPKATHCEVCSKARKIYFDHCHLTGKFRGWRTGRDPVHRVPSGGKPHYSPTKKSTRPGTLKLLRRPMN